MIYLASPLWRFRFLSAFWVFVCCLATVPVCRAQDARVIRIDSVQLGFSTRVSDGSKPGFWTPVYVSVTTGPKRINRGELILVVEASDGDDNRNQYRQEVPSLEPHEQSTLVTYTKPGSVHDTIRVSLAAGSQVVASKEDAYLSLPLDRHLYLVLGGQLPGLRQALTPLPESLPGRAAEEAPDEREPVQRITELGGVRQFPDRWFGYQSVDLLILPTGDRDFLTSFLNEREGRREALAEWVRRGGHLLVSVGRNQDVVAQFDMLQGMLPVTIKGADSVALITGISSWAGPTHGALENPVPADKPGSPRPSFEMTRMEPRADRQAEVLIQERNKQALVVRGAYGLGKVTVVGFDLDRPPFATWVAKGRENFWKRLLTESATAGASDHRAANEPQVPGQPGAHRDLGTQLGESLENFPTVPVISFGWVALFILVYILIVGPLDYLFLKKVVKRLELTWITFPTVVLTISIAAYFTAYWLKGDDQRINKVDLLDIDLQSQQIYGTSWFTIFSPRIQNYVIGLEPAEGLGQTGSRMNLSWMGRPGDDWRGTGRYGSGGGLFQRPYYYAPDATGLEKVPIPVWSTKSFVADWSVPMNAAKPAFVADLRRGSGTQQNLSGTLTSNLPFPVEDAFILQGRNAYSLGTLFPGTPRRVDSIFNNADMMETATWVGTAPAKLSQKVGDVDAQTLANSTSPIFKRILFHQYDHSRGDRDDQYRSLDQSWRVYLKNEAVVFGRIASSAGVAEEVNAGAGTPSRLWIGNLPAPGASRPALQGVLAQTGYVRIFIPVATSQ